MQQPRLELIHETLPAEVRHVQALGKLIQQAIKLAERRPQLDSAVYTRRVEKIEHALDAWLDRVPLNGSRDLDRLVSHVASHRGE